MKTSSQRQSMVAAILMLMAFTGSCERDKLAAESTETLSIMQNALVQNKGRSFEFNEEHEESGTDMKDTHKNENKQEKDKTGEKEAAQKNKKATEEKAVTNEKEMEKERPSRGFQQSGAERLSRGFQESGAESVMSLQSQIEHLEFQAKKGTFTQTPEERQELQDVIKTLTSTFQQKLVNESQEDQRTFNVMKDQHKACITHKKRRFNLDYGDVTRSKNLTEETKQKHKACRKMQKSLEEFQADAKIVGSKPWSEMVVVDDTSHPEELKWVCPNKIDFTADLKVYRKTPPVDHVSPSCQYDQKNAESQFCDWLAAKRWACQAFDECIRQVGLQQAKETRKSREGNRKALWFTIQQLKCRLKHIWEAFPNASHDASHFNQSDDCHNTPAEEPGVLTLSMTVPDYQGCTTVGENEPSTKNTTKCAAFKNEFYPEMMNDTKTLYANVDDCQEDCPAAPPPDIGIPGCVDNDDVKGECAFYRRHRDACGKYKTDASDNCCACQEFTPMGIPSIGASSKCTMENGWYKVVGEASCMLGAPDGTPLVVDYTKKKYTKYAFIIKLASSDGNNAHNNNVHPHGGFKPCNLDSTSTSRGNSPELFFIDRKMDWGWGLALGGFTRNYQYKTEGTSSDPHGNKELNFELYMKWENNQYTIYSWKVADDKFPLYTGEKTVCSPNDNYAFTPRLWSYRSADTLYMKDLIISQSDTPPTVD